MTLTKEILNQAIVEATKPLIKHLKTIDTSLATMADIKLALEFEYFEHLETIDISLAVMADLALAKAFYDEKNQRELLYQCVGLLRASRDARQELHTDNITVEQATGDTSQQTQEVIKLSLKASDDLGEFNALHPIIYRLALATQRQN